MGGRGWWWVAMNTPLLRFERQRGGWGQAEGGGGWQRVVGGKKHPSACVLSDGGGSGRQRGGGRQRAVVGGRGW